MNINKNKIVAALITVALFNLAGPLVTFAYNSPATINLGTANNFVILSKTGISSTGVTKIVGDIGVSPIAASAITGFALILPAAGSFSTSVLVTGKIYAPDYANPTPANLTTAVSDMQTAYVNAMGRAPNVTELGAGNISGLTIAPGVYKWGTGVTIPTDVTLSGSANDIWIFQIAQTLSISSGKQIILSGGAQANNVFWVVAGQTTIGTNAVFNGNVLDQTAIVVNTGAKLNGRALAQTAVTLDSNAVTKPTSGVITSVASPTPTTPAVKANPVVAPVDPTSSHSSQGSGRQTEQVNSAQTSSGSGIVKDSGVSVSSDINVILQQIQIRRLLATLQSLQAQIKSQNSGSSPTSAPVFGQQVRSITVNLGQGSCDENVTILQQFLVSQGKGSATEALAKVGPTGYFGVLTRTALIEFQTKSNLPALGNFGPMTRDYLKANY